jgi:hypothetical protein
VAGDDDSYSEDDDCADPDRSMKMFRDIDTPEKNDDFQERSSQIFRDVFTPHKGPQMSSDTSHKDSPDISSNIFRDIDSVCKVKFNIFIHIYIIYDLVFLYIHIYLLYNYLYT